MKTKPNSNEQRDRRSLHGVAMRLAEVLEREVMHCNQSASKAPEPYAPGFIVAGAVLKHLADELRAEAGKPHSEKLTHGG